MNVFHRNEAIGAMLEAHSAGKISNKNMTLGGVMICRLFDAQPSAELSKWDGSPRIVAAAPPSPEWTSYRDGRRVMHYLRASGGRYYVQKVEAGYNVSFLADEGDGVSVCLSTESTLAAGKKWVADHLSAAPTKEHPTLADCAAKFEDEPLYECEIPGTPGRVTRGGADITPGVHTVKLTGAQDDGRGGIRVGFEVIDSRTYQAEAISDCVSILPAEGFGPRVAWMTLDDPGYKAKKHRPTTYNSITLGIDSFKVVRMDGVRGIDQYEQLLAQDARVCRIEQELVQYAGKRRTPHRDRKVAKLRKIMRILKRGVYE